MSVDAFTCIGELWQNGGVQWWELPDRLDSKVVRLCTPWMFRRDEGGREEDVGDSGAFLSHCGGGGKGGPEFRHAPKRARVWPTPNVCTDAKTEYNNGQTAVRLRTIAKQPCTRTDVGKTANS